MSSLETWSAWIKRQLDERDWNYAEAERRAGVAASVWAQWVRVPARRVSLENVHAVARGLGVPVKTVMVIARYLTPEQADVVPVLEDRLALVDASDEQLAKELLERIRARRPEPDLKHYDRDDLPPIPPKTDVHFVDSDGRQVNKTARRR
jgi:transcriptional regulator with XRE-family HTH domain